jgi:hypothetical protein
MWSFRPILGFPRGSQVFKKSEPRMGATIVLALSTTVDSLSFVVTALPSPGTSWHPFILQMGLKVPVSVA